ncbi:hypothetical protein ABJI51_30745 [Amycolatopsis sp. NEAU-NG30]|uniref:YkgJ family cysteine cluster protein n=1 Tax=Amycolatopsis melonis TaxID=3156488 RepID=A0ABV0LME3_9PSEU
MRGGGEAGESLAYRDARVSPCAACEAAPCCQYLPLTTFAMATLSDVDYARYLLNFDNIELGVTREGAWSVYYRQACRFLDADTLGCRLHGTPDKPHVCVQYNPFSCFYRTAFSPGGAEGYLRVDRRRLDVIVEALTFDADRRVVAAPTVESLAEAFEALPIESAVVPPRPAEPAPVQPGDLADPCVSCPAYCCTTVLFPITPPVSISSLDYLRFALGFPGTEIVVLGTEWQLAVSARCRHLEDGRCAVFGTPDRPLRCEYHDAWTCGPRAAFDGAGIESSVRIRLEDFPALAGACAFHLDGTAAMVPGATELRPVLAAGTLDGDAAPGHRQLLPLSVVSPASQEP